jgi:hypothetical protein
MSGRKPALGLANVELGPDNSREKITTENAQRAGTLPKVPTLKRLGVRNGLVVRLRHIAKPR